MTVPLIVKKLSLVIIILIILILILSKNNTNDKANPQTTTLKPKTVISLGQVSHLLPNRTVCGKQEEYSGKILNGNKTHIFQYPWMLLLVYRVNETITSHGCGGSLISSKFAITAAHCVTGYDAVKKGTVEKVTLGEYDTSTARDCLDGFCNNPIEIPIKKIIAHEDYNHSLNRNDIAMLKLAFEVSYTDFIRPICLPESDNSSNFTKNLAVAGWGTTESRKISKLKLHLYVPFVSLADCQNSYNTPKLKSSLWDKQICAGGKIGQDACSGDSGGPLMYREKSYTWELIGVVSFGSTPCGLKGIPGIYTKVYAYLPWIYSNIYYNQ